VEEFYSREGAARDVVAMPSLQEAWGLVVAKAFASGSLIGSNVGGISGYHREDFVLY